MIRTLIIKLGAILPKFLFDFHALRYLKLLLYSGHVASRCNVIDKANFTIEPSSNIVGGRNILIHSAHIRRYSRISAIARYNNVSYYPHINIGMNANIGINNHIAAINNVTIGNNFLTGANCLITDHSHGNGILDITISPNDRLLYSKGPIIIGDNVHLGENVIILPNVIIGDNVVIGAGSVVTKNLPNNCIAVGNPARIVKEA